MNAFCKLHDLRTESDVEQKLVWELLTSPFPLGAGHIPAEVRTKTDIRKVEIGKGGGERKLYFPDYLIVMGGLPMVVVEVKTPSEDITVAQREARLYALEVNARFPIGLNPCQYTLTTNGRVTILSSWDSETPIHRVEFDDIYAENIAYNNVLELLRRNKQKDRAQSILDSLRKKDYVRPAKEVGGDSSRNEELSPNSFGSSLIFNYRHVFNPTSVDERRSIVQNAYIASARRDRHVQSIDKVIRAASPPSVSTAREIEDTEHPREITDQLKDFKKVTNQVLLLIGGVGAGKSTFVDYLQEVALPHAVRDSTLWIRINLNSVTLDKSRIYEWIKDQIIAELKIASSEHDFDDLEIIKHVYKRELQSIRGILKLLTLDSPAYNERLVDAILKFQEDKMATIRGIERFTCASRGKMLVIVLDNCDKRGRDDQLLMFEVAQWIQHEIRCLVFLPIRDVTYDHHRGEPPLDTALKDLIYRIESPSFQQVVESRIRLAVTEMQESGLAKTATYGLGDNIKVEYSTSNLAVYLEKMRLAFFQQNAFARKVITGIAGGDIRRAMEMFLAFCNSHYIPEEEIFKITNLPNDQSQGVPNSVIYQILMRGNRRFYNGDLSYVKNLFQCNPRDTKPEYFIRLDILTWLYNKRNERGTNGFRGYHRAEKLIVSMVGRGYEAEAVEREINYLAKALCVGTEHQRTDFVVFSDDLITLAPAGFVHLDIVEDVDYMATCSEDIWYEESGPAYKIVKRIAGGGSNRHFDPRTIMNNAAEATDYLRKVADDPQLPPTEEFLENTEILPYFCFARLQANIDRAFRDYYASHPRK